LRFRYSRHPPPYLTLVVPCFAIPSSASSSSSVSVHKRRSLVSSHYSNWWIKLIVQLKFSTSPAPSSYLLNTTDRSLLLKFQLPGRHERAYSYYLAHVSIKIISNGYSSFMFIVTFALSEIKQHAFTQGLMTVESFLPSQLIRNHSYFEFSIPLF
jgi:hypothetical protein